MFPPHIRVLVPPHARNTRNNPHQSIFNLQLAVTAHEHIAHGHQASQAARPRPPYPAWPRDRAAAASGLGAGAQGQARAGEARRLGQAPVPWGRTSTLHLETQVGSCCSVEEGVHVLKVPGACQAPAPERGAPSRWGGGDGDGGTPKPALAMGGAACLWTQEVRHHLTHHIPPHPTWLPLVTAVQEVAGRRTSPRCN